MDIVVITVFIVVIGLLEPEEGWFAQPKFSTEI